MFIKRSGSQFVIIAIYVDDLNIIETTDELSETVNYLFIINLSYQSHINMP